MSLEAKNFKTSIFKLSFYNLSLFTCPPELALGGENIEATGTGLLSAGRKLIDGWGSESRDGKFGIVEPFEWP